MKRRIETSTRKLSIGDVYHLTEHGEHVIRVLAQGPKYFVYECDGKVNFGEAAEEVE